jgi:hypothetical protein
MLLTRWRLYWKIILHIILFCWPCIPV